MVIPIRLHGTSMGKRHFELNLRVISAAADNINIDDIKEDKMKSDVDRIFKIDLASKYKNIDYIIDTLKSGDSLYISRALKCTWLFNGEQSNIINPSYLHHNIFPFMSIKMKKKLLTTISMHIQDEKRAEDFYKYCINSKMPQHAFKFLIFTSCEFKQDMIKNNYDTLRSLLNDPMDIKFIIGNDFTLAEFYLDTIYRMGVNFNAFYFLCYFYSLDSEKYLGWLEKYTVRPCLGLRISRDIMKKYKNKIIKNVSFYVDILNRKVFVRHTTLEEAKQYAVALLPSYSREFWSVNRSESFYESYKFILDIIPLKERYKFIKKIFYDKYPNEEFEMTEYFYHQGYYKLMTVEERESWALCHLSSGKSFLSKGQEDREYIWYSFINFDTSIVAIKKYIIKTPDADKRATLIRVLIECTRNQSDIEKLLKYFYERHNNETRSLKEDVLCRVMNDHNVYEFNDSCWKAFQNLLFSVEVYNPSINTYKNETLQQVALVYHILYKMEIPEGLQTYFDQGICWYRMRSCMENLNQEKKDQMYDFLLQAYLNKLKNFEDVEYNEHAATAIRGPIDDIRELQEYMKKPKEECPELALKFMKLDHEYYYPIKTENDKLTGNDLLRLLKKDASKVVENLPRVKRSIEQDYSFKYNTFLKKLKIYFPNDIAQDYVKFFKESLSEKCDQHIIFTYVYTIFQLADESLKSEFMSKYVPDKPKIDHREIERTHLYIQEAICRFACYSRPPVPLQTFLPYIKGDYIRYCLPMFNMYRANLPPNPRFEFVKALLDSAVSVQKHALRLAFKCFNVEDLKHLLLTVWNKSKNISLRMVIYTYLLDDIKNRGDDENRDDMFKVFLDLTSQLHEDDHDEVINILTSYQVPEEIRGAFIETAWKTISQFPDTVRNVSRIDSVICNITSNIEVVDKVVVRAIINDYLNAMFVENQIVQMNDNNCRIDNAYKKRNESKRELALTYVGKFNDEENLKYGTKFVKFVLTKCLEMWNENLIQGSPCYKFYFIRDYCHRFIKDLVDKHYSVTSRNYTAINPIFEDVLLQLQSVLPLYEIYTDVWNLRLKLIINKILDESLKERDNGNSNWKTLTKLLRKYAQEVSKIVQEFVDKDLFNTTFLNEVAGTVSKHINNMNYTYSLPASTSYQVHAVACTEFVQYNTKETVLLAVKLLPDAAATCNIHESVLFKIKKFENFEVQSLLYQKFRGFGFKENIS